jgi:hypothetical protein
LAWLLLMHAAPTVNALLDTTATSLSAALQEIPPQSRVMEYTARPQLTAPLITIATSSTSAFQELLPPALFPTVLAIQTVLVPLVSTAMSSRDASMVNQSRVTEFTARPQPIVPQITTATSSISVSQVLLLLPLFLMVHAILMAHAPLASTAMSSSVASMENLLRATASIAKLLLTVLLITTAMNSTSVYQEHPPLALFPMVHATLMAHAPPANTAMSSSVALTESLLLEPELAMLMDHALLDSIATNSDDALVAMSLRPSFNEVLITI